MFHVHRDSYTAVSNNTRPTPRTRVGALSRCHPGHRDTPVGPGRTPTVHRCPRGEAVGGPSTNTTHVVRRSTEHITLTPPPDRPKFRAFFFSLQPKISFFLLSLGGLFVRPWPRTAERGKKRGEISAPRPPCPPLQHRPPGPHPGSLSS